MGITHPDQHLAGGIIEGVHLVKQPADFLLDGKGRFFWLLAAVLDQVEECDPAFSFDDFRRLFAVAQDLTDLVYRFSTIQINDLVFIIRLANDCLESHVVAVRGEYAQQLETCFAFFQGAENGNQMFPTIFSRTNSK